MTTIPPRSYLWLFWLLAVVGFAADQVSKYAVLASLYQEGHEGRSGKIEGSVVFLEDRLSLRHTFSGVKETGDGALARLRTLGGDGLPTVNQGAVAGFLTGNNWLFALITMVASAAIIYWCTRTPAGSSGYLCLALGLILGGALGNLYDRIIFAGVRDFISFISPVFIPLLCNPNAVPTGGYEWPDFNIADCFLVCGAIMLLLEALIAKPKATSETASQASAIDSKPRDELCESRG